MSYGRLAIEATRSAGTKDPRTVRDALARTAVAGGGLSGVQYRMPWDQEQTNALFAHFDRCQEGRADADTPMTAGLQGFIDNYRAIIE